MIINANTTDTTITLLKTDYSKVPCYEQKNKVQPGVYVTGRMIFVCRTVQKDSKQIFRTEASKIIAREMINNWISKNIYHIYPKTERAVAKRIKDSYDEMSAISKHLRTVTNKKWTLEPEWKEKVSQFNKSMNDNAYNIRAKNLDLQKSLEE